MVRPPVSEPSSTPESLPASAQQGVHLLPASQAHPPFSLIGGRRSDWADHLADDETKVRECKRTTGDTTTRRAADAG